MIHFELNSLDGVGQGLRFTLLAYGYAIITTTFFENETLILNSLLYINFYVMYNISCKHFLPVHHLSFYFEYKGVGPAKLYFCAMKFIMFSLIVA